MNKIFSVVGIFDSAHDLMEAIPDVKRKAKDNVEAYTPYPIEGIEKLLGLKKSPIGGMVLVMGAIGALAGLALELWTSGIDYPQITAGKPPLSWDRRSYSPRFDACFSSASATPDKPPVCKHGWLQASCHQKTH